MASSRKVLGQSSPSSGITAVLYTCPASTQCIVSTAVACNRGNGDAQIRISVAVGAEVLGDKQFIIYDQVVHAKASFAATIGVTMTATDMIRVLSDNGLVSFNLFGVEIT